jgi:hypothetical protein
MHQVRYGSQLTKRRQITLSMRPPGTDSTKESSNDSLHQEPGQGLHLRRSSFGMSNHVPPAVHPSSDGFSDHNDGTQGRWNAPLPAVEATVNKYCPQCGVEWTEPARFCGKCGSPAGVSAQRSDEQAAVSGGAATITAAASSLTDFSAVINRGLARAAVVRDERSRRRVVPTLWNAAYAVAGFVGATGIIALLVGGGDSPNRALTAILSLFLAVSMMVFEEKFPGRFSSGVVAATIVATLAFWLAVCVSPEDSSPGQVGAALAFTILSLVLLYFFEPHVAGLTPLIGVGAVMLLGMIVLNTTPDEVSDPFCESSLGSCISFDDLVESGVNSALSLMLVVGIVFLAAAFVLDRKGRHGAATALIPAGAIAFMAGITKIVAGYDENNFAGGLVLVLGGAGMMLVGHNGNRRFSTWFGALAVLGGIYGISAQESVVGTALVSVLLVSGLTAAAVVLQNRLESGGLQNFFVATPVDDRPVVVENAD